MSEKFIENLTKKIKEQGITKTKLAKEVGIPESTIRMWEKGSEPTIDKVIKISRYFAIPIAELLGIEEHYKNDDELLEYFHKLPEREQIKWIGKLEEAAKEYISSNSQNTQSKIS